MTLGRFGIGYVCIGAAKNSSDHWWGNAGWDGLIVPWRRSFGLARVVRRLTQPGQLAIRYCSVVSFLIFFEPWLNKSETLVTPTHPYTPPGRGMLCGFMGMGLIGVTNWNWTFVDTSGVQHDFVVILAILIIPFILFQNNDVTTCSVLARPLKGKQSALILSLHGGNTRNH